MALTVNHPRRRHGWRYHEAAVSESATRVRVYRPMRVATMGTLIVLVGAWAGIVAFVGPEFAYRPTSASPWQWTTANWLLHLVPGAMAVAAGLAAIGLARASTAGARGMLLLAALTTFVAGSWLIIGPSLWPVFESGSPYGAAASANMSFAHQVGANLGPGILLVALGAMIFQAVSASRMAPAPATAPVTAADPPAAGPVTPAGGATVAEPPTRSDIPVERVPTEGDAP